MSGILGALLGGSNEGGGQSAAIANVIQQVLSQNGGGISSLLARFTQAGLGDHAQSWVNGDQQPLTPEDIDRVFTQDEITNWAAQAGTDPNRMRMVLAEALPHAVDHATPNGAIPPPDAKPDLSSLIRRFMGGAAAILLMMMPAWADESVAGNWKAHLGSGVSITMNVTPDGKWDSQTWEGDVVVAQLAGVYDQAKNTPTSGMMVFTPKSGQTEHGTPEVEHDRYQLSPDGKVLRMTAGNDTMVFRKQ